MTNNYGEKIKQQLKIMNQSLETFNNVLKPIFFSKEIIIPLKMN